jgi:catecholate siderophore receptor
MKQTSDDRPDYGLPWFGTRPAPAPRDAFYGFDSDYLETDADLLSGQVLHRIGDAVRLDIQARYADYDRSNRITEPLLTPVPPANTPAEQISVFRYVFAGTSNETLATTQAVARVDLDTGPIRHALVTGVELSRETSAPMFAFGVGVPSTSLLNPDSSQPFTAASLEPRIVADTAATTTALFALDTLKLNESWQVTLGARWDRFDTSYVADRFAGPPTPFNAGIAAGREEFAQLDELASWRAAVVYKPAEWASVYLASSTSFNPSSQSLSFLTTGRSLGTENTFLDPEENESLELGFKADLAEYRLALSTAVFEITKTNARVPDPMNPGFNTLGGEQRVRGVSVDLVGMATERLYLATGYAYLDGEVVRGAAGAAVGATIAKRRSTRSRFGGTIASRVASTWGSAPATSASCTRRASSTAA